MTKPMTPLERKSYPRSQAPQKQTPRLQIHDYMSVRKYVISDPPMIDFRHYIKNTNDTPSVVWQQQMEKAYMKPTKKYITIAQTDNMSWTTLKTMRLNSALYHWLKNITLTTLTPSTEKYRIGTMNYTTNKIYNIDRTIILQLTTRMIPK